MLGRSHRSFGMLTAATAIATLVAASSAVLAAGDPVERAKKRGERFTAEFRLDDCTFVTNDDDSPGNPFFPLVPGNQIVLENEEDVELEITTCLDDGSNCSDQRRHAGSRSLHRRARRHRDPGGRGARVRRTASWSRSRTTSSRAAARTARCSTSARRSRTSRTARWSAAAAPGRPGSAMPCPASSCRASILLGSRYFQEMAPGVALDRGEHTA